MPASIEGNRDALGWLRGEHSVFVPGENRERNVRLIDYAEPDRNVFQVTTEWWQKGVVYRNRADVVFLINGVPVAVAETKGASKANGLAEGVDQIRRYHRETPELFAAAQLFEVTHPRLHVRGDLEHGAERPGAVEGRAARGGRLRAEWWGRSSSVGGS